MNELQIDVGVRGNYRSADLYLVPRARMYVDLLERVFDAFDEETLELVIEESSMPLTYYDALEIPLEVFEDKHGIEDEEELTVDEVVGLCEDLLGLGLFDIGFRGDNISVFIAHDGFLNVKPEAIEPEEFKRTIESLREEDDGDE